MSPAAPEPTTRATSCTTHTETIQTLQTQVDALTTSLDRTETARITLLDFLYAIDKLVQDQRPDVTTRMLYNWLARASRKTHTAHTRAWSGTKPEPGPS